MKFRLSQKYKFNLVGQRHEMVYPPPPVFWNEETKLNLETGNTVHWYTGTVSTVQFSENFRFRQRIRDNGVPTVNFYSFEK